MRQSPEPEAGGADLPRLYRILQGISESVVKACEGKRVQFIRSLASLAFSTGELSYEFTPIS